MGGIEKALTRLAVLDRGETGSGYVPDSRCSLIVTIVYLGAMLGVPVDSLSHLIWFAFYPIVASAVLGVNFSTIFRQSLYVLPIVALVGIANPFFNREAAFTVAGVTVSRGWVEYVSILLRGVLSVQAVLLLCAVSGFSGVCRALSRLGVPAFLTSQLLLVYRYLGVLLGEALDMRRAIESRGYGHKSLPLKRWGAFVGQLLIRTVGRSERIHRAMIARGFEGSFHFSDGSRWTGSDTAYLIVWCVLIAALRFFNPSSLIFMS